MYRTEAELEHNRAELSESFYRQHELNQLLKDECEHRAFLDAQVEQLRAELRRRESEAQPNIAPAEAEQQQQLVEQLRHELETQAELLHGERTRCTSLSDQLLALGEQHSRLQSRLEETSAARDAHERTAGELRSSIVSLEAQLEDARRQADEQLDALQSELQAVRSSLDSECRAHEERIEALHKLALKSDSQRDAAAVDFDEADAQAGTSDGPAAVDDNDGDMDKWTVESIAPELDSELESERHQSAEQLQPEVAEAVHINNYEEQQQCNLREDELLLQEQQLRAQSAELEAERLRLDSLREENARLKQLLRLRGYELDSSPSEEEPTTASASVPNVIHWTSNDSQTISARDERESSGRLEFCARVSDRSQSQSQSAVCAAATAAADTGALPGLATPSDTNADSNPNPNVTLAQVQRTDVETQTLAASDAAVEHPDADVQEERERELHLLRSQLAAATDSLAQWTAECERLRALVVELEARCAQWAQWYAARVSSLVDIEQQTDDDYQVDMLCTVHCTRTHRFSVLSYI